MPQFTPDEIEHIRKADVIHANGEQIWGKSISDVVKNARASNQPINLPKHNVMDLRDRTPEQVAEVLKIKSSQCN